MEQHFNYLQGDNVGANGIGFNQGVINLPFDFNDIAS